MKKNFRFVFITFSIFSLFSLISCESTKAGKEDSDASNVEAIEVSENTSSPENMVSSQDENSENASNGAENEEAESMSAADTSETEEFDFENAEIIPEDEAYFISEEPLEEKENAETAPEITEEPVVKEVPIEVNESKEIISSPVIAAGGSVKSSFEENKNVPSEETALIPQNEISQEPLTVENSEDSQNLAENTTEDAGEDKEIKDETEDLSEKVPVIPSRTVTLQKGQYLDVEYPGNGWVYLGEEEDQKLVTYFGRKLGKGNTVFTLRTRNSGTTLLHFYKNDALTGTYIDDYLEVIIEDKIGSSTQRTTAPLYSEVVPKKPEKVVKTQVIPSANEQIEEKTAKTSENSSSLPLQLKNKKPSQAVTSSSDDVKNTGKTVIQTTEDDVNSKSPVIENNSSFTAQKSNDETVSSSNDGSRIDLPSDNDSLLELAQKSYDTEKYTDALAAVQRYLDNSGDRTDEALYLQGLIYEADSPEKNIRNAIDCFDTIVKNYPASSLWKKARNRSIYLKRFYVEIR